MLDMSQKTRRYRQLQKVESPKKKVVRVTRDQNLHIMPLPIKLQATDAMAKAFENRRDVVVLGTRKESEPMLVADNFYSAERMKDEDPFKLSVAR